jgi:RHS repeat-associated protein
VWNNKEGSGSPDITKFVYDGWNLIAELDANNAPLRSYVWGTDLSGTIQGAGGVGGLLAMKVHDDPLAGNYFYCYDGNGNVLALVNAANGAIAARYEYGPFGELIRKTGDLADINPFRFSTKYQDDETGYNYFGFRYFDSGSGRWISGDPVGEMGGLNIFAFFGNSPIGEIAFLGLLTFKCPPRVRLHIGIDEGDPVSKAGAFFAGGHLKVTYKPLARGVSADSVSAELEKTKRLIDYLLGSSCIERLTIGGHGTAIGARGNVLSTDMITTTNGQFVEFLNYLSSKMCSDERSIKLMACSSAAKDEGRKFIVELAKFMQSPVIGYDQPYGPWPHGGEWRATPESSSPELIGQRWSYEGSMAHYTINPRGFFDYYVSRFGPTGPYIFGN